MTALPSRPLRRLPLAGGLTACAALGAALLVGPGGTPIPAALLAGVAALLILAEVGRRVVVLLRSGYGPLVAIGVLAVGALASVWSLVTALHLENLAAGMLLGLIGVALVATPLIEARGRMAAGLTPWQSLTGGPTGPARWREAQRRYGPALLGSAMVAIGLQLLVSGLMSGSSVISDGGRIVVSRAENYGAPGILLLLGFGGFLAIVFAWMVVALFRRPRAVYVTTPAAPGGLTPDAGASGPAAPASPGATTRDPEVVAAHLHDSVLQTLSLIQRSAADPARVAQLARQQERSLRSWLAGRDDTSTATVAGALRAAAAEVEDEQPGAVIEVVAVGDAPMDRATDALVRAGREAMRNAARHGGSPVRVFLEIDAGRRELFVRDRGAGFTLGDVPQERRGVRDAIIGRMEHVGGTAEIDTSPAGTEIALRLPPAAPGDDRS